MVLDHHFVSEVWPNEYKKWVVFDIGNTSNSLRSSFYQKDEIPLDSLEIHNLANVRKIDKIWVTPAGIHDKFKATEDKKEGVLEPRQFKPRFGVPFCKCIPEETRTIHSLACLPAVRLPGRILLP